jgi:hypothetical protein
MKVSGDAEMIEIEQNGRQTPRPVKRRTSLLFQRQPRVAGDAERHHRSSPRRGADTSPAAVPDSHATYSSTSSRQTMSASAFSTCSMAATWFSLSTMRLKVITRSGFSALALPSPRLFDETHERSACSIADEIKRGQHQPGATTEQCEDQHRSAGNDVLQPEMRQQIKHPAIASQTAQPGARERQKQR